LGLVAIVMLIAGCADLAQLLPGPAEEALPSAFVVPTPAQVFPPEMSTAARLLARGEMVVGVRYDLEPFSYITADSQLAGLEIDLARELARRWLGSPDAVRFVQVRSDTAYTYLAAGTVDIVFAGLVHTQDAEVRADFSPPYFANGMALLTFPDTGIQALADLDGKTVGTVSWTESADELAASTSVSVTQVAYEHTADAIEALRLRQIDVYVDHRHRLERARNMVVGSVIVGQWTWEPVSMIYRQNDPFFADLVMLTFEDMAADGTRDALYDRWLPGTSPPSSVRLGGSGGDGATPALDATPQQISTQDVMARIRDRGSVAVGYFRTRWPYSGDRADGVPTGFEVRLVEQLAELWLGSISAVTFVPVVDEDDALQRLERGEVDILIGAWVRTREGELRVDYSIPILDDGVSIMSLATNPINELPQLSGQAVGVVVGSSAEAAVPGFSQGVGLSSRGYPTFEAALAGLQTGEVVALLTERWPALDVHFRQTDYAFTDRRYTYRPVALVVPEGDSDFHDLVNLSLMWLQSQGIYQELYSLWFDDAVPELESWPGLATSLVIQR
ncbi:MAG: transporter substrate-binding domain-containing protein, partial [Anaerolineae bacterium]|nr:transporter substrate-binding domain-containing protein [Anaerolineae bacterium]